MNWANYVDGQTGGVIKHPASFASATVIFAVIFGERLADLHRKVRESQRLRLLVAIRLLASVGGGYFLARTIRQLRDGSKQSFPAPSRNDWASRQ